MAIIVLSVMFLLVALTGVAYYRIGFRDGVMETERKLRLMEHLKNAK